MKRRLVWDEAKREANLAKHGLDFADATLILDSAYRLDVMAVRGGEMRTQSFSYVMERLAVLTLVHLPRDDATRIVSFRYASEEESDEYYEWLKKTQRPTREAILKAMQSKPAGGYFVWDGKDEDERPLTCDEMQAGIEADRRRRGRPAGSSKSSTTIRFDTDVLEAFRAGGPGWQTRMNEVLRRWLKRHPTAR